MQTILKNEFEDVLSCINDLMSAKCDRVAQKTNIVNMLEYLMLEKDISSAIGEIIFELNKDLKKEKLGCKPFSLLGD